MSGRRVCSIEGCGRGHLARGYCQQHYHRWKRYGDPLHVGRPFHPERLCGVRGCEGTHYGRGWCQAHYRRWVESGDPLTLKTLPWPERFWDKVTQTECCWVWTGATDPAGYGRSADESGAIKLAHRVAYLLSVGPIPEATPELDHLCRVECCVRPDHLEPVTKDENRKRQASAKRLGLGPCCDWQTAVANLRREESDLASRLFSGA